MKGNSAPGPDNISAKMLKPVDSAVSYPLADFQNVTLEMERVPKAWKQCCTDL